MRMRTGVSWEVSGVRVMNARVASRVCTAARRLGGHNELEAMGTEE